MKLLVKCLGLLGALLMCVIESPLRAADDALAWPAPTAQTRPWTYWWWMGSAVDKTNLTRELERYHAAGLGGVHIIPIYGAKGWEDKSIKYLSPQWMEMLDWTVSEAKRLGMGVDMTTGTGWCFGGPQITDKDANANVVVKTYELKAGEKLNQKFDQKNTQALVAYGPGGKAIELTDKISPEDSVDFTATNGGWTIYAISQKPSGQKVKRPAPGGEGWMLNPVYPAAMDDFLAPFTAAFAAYTGPKPRAQYHDSYEYRTDWSPDFFAEFEKRRGYRLQDELPALFSKADDEHANRVKGDYRQTVSDIMVEETFSKWVDWSHEHGFITRNEAHGAPGNLLDLYALADIPETEFFSKQRNPLVAKFASSAAHVTGKQLVASETGTWLDEHFHETLAQMKGLVDDLFLSGVNHVFYHGTCYSPDEAGWPGWVFYAATEMNPRNSIWRDVPALNAYIARVQSVLQSGRPDNDILLYWNTADLWMQPGDKLLSPLQVEQQAKWFTPQPVGRVAQELWDKGYAFDYVSDAQLKTAKIIDGKIQMPGGNYKFIVVPECKYIPLETFKRLLALAKSGATVIFEKQLPADVSGAGKLEEQKSELQDLKSKLAPHWNGNRNPGYQGYQIGSGWIYAGEFGLSGMKSLQGAVAAESLVESGLCFVRRSFDGGWNYFIVNRTETNFDGWIRLGQTPNPAVILDPMSGKAGYAQVEEFYDHKEIHLQLPANGSAIVKVFENGPSRKPSWAYWETNGRPAEITGTWNVKFLEGGPVLPVDFSTAKLASWTTFADTNCQSFAGTAKYEVVFDAPKGGDVSANFELSLGDVRQSARVKLNGKDYGTLFMPPFRVVVDHLQPTGNKLEVEVTSVAANRIRDLDRRGVKWKNFSDINFVDINYKPFDASNWPLVDCGLLGPVTLTPVVSQP